ncbi:hypothetical protein PENTCL1PPCAC_24930, partial [Pristionchus entomophagus]
PHLRSHVYRVSRDSEPNMCCSPGRVYLFPPWGFSKQALHRDILRSCFHELSHFCFSFHFQSYRNQQLFILFCSIDSDKASNISYCSHLRRMPLELYLKFTEL